MYIYIYVDSAISVPCKRKAGAAATQVFPSPKHAQRWLRPKQQQSRMQQRAGRRSRRHVDQPMQCRRLPSSWATPQLGRTVKQVRVDEFHERSLSFPCSVAVTSGQKCKAGGREQNALSDSIRQLSKSVQRRHFLQVRLKGCLTSQQHGPK